MTVNGEAFVLATDHISREWMYVTLSRATDRSRIYIDSPTTTPAPATYVPPNSNATQRLLDVYDLALRSDAQTLARDHGRPVDPQHLDRNDLRRAMNRDAALTERMRDHRQQQPGRELEPRQRGGFGRGIGR